MCAREYGSVAKLLVLGNAAVDVLCAVPHLPRPGETVVGSRGGRAPGGKGLNQAVVAARAGASVSFVACVGQDDAAREVAEWLHGEGLARIRLIPQPVATDQSLLMVAPDGENSIISFGAAADALQPAEAESIANEVEPGDILLAQGNLSQAATLAAFQRGAARGARMIFNTAPLLWNCSALLPLCAVVVANAVEAEAITGITGAGAAQALHDAGANIAIVTLGADGCVVADAAGLRHHPATPVEVVDTTGAGDTVCGILAARLLAGDPIDDAIRMAQHAAGLTVQRPGAFDALPTAAELRTVLSI